MGGFFNELKRRNVFRVGIAYVVVGWLVLQVVDTVAPGLGWPDWVMSFFIVLIAVGLPIALLFAWAFELTPEGVKKTENVKPGEGVTAATGQKLNYVIIGALVLALGYFVWDRQAGQPPDPAPAAIADSDRPTIAVLPFVNMSADPEQEFFSDGITEEILNMLVRERALKVVSRTSVFSFKGRNLDIPTIAGRLGAAYVVEGSVRRSGDTLRITAQLIEAASDTHLWSETFDRPYADVFAVQEEIATAISSALSQSLGFGVSSATDASRMDDLVAYENFLRARAHLRNREMPEAVALFEKVVVREPDFAPAWSFYSISLHYLMVQSANSELTRSGAARFMARRAARRAFELAPDDAYTQYALGLEARYEGRELDEIAHFERALAVDPENALVLEDIVQTLDDFLVEEAAAPMVERLLTADPLWAVGRMVAGMYRARVEMDSESLPLRIEALISLDPDFGPVHGLRIRTLIELRRWGEAIAAQAQARQALQGSDFDADILHADIPAIRDWAEDPERVPFEEGPLANSLGPGASSFLTGSFVVLSDDPDEIFALAMKVDRAAALKVLERAARYADLNYLWADPRMKEFILLMESRWDLPLTAVWRKYGWPKFCRPLGADDFECGVFESRP